MAIALGKDIVSSYTGITNDNIIDVTATDEAETAKVSARGSAGWNEYAPTFLNTTIEVKCLGHALAVGQAVGALVVTNIVTNEPLDDAVTYDITMKSQ
jgi:hypothetical protein